MENISNYHFGAYIDLYFQESTSGRGFVVDSDLLIYPVNRDAFSFIPPKSILNGKLISFVNHSLGSRTTFSLAP